MHPKRCCSSIITSARPLNCTCSGKWRAYQQSSAPDRWRWLLVSQSCFTFLFSGEPAYFDTEGANQLRKLLACCSASNSVGASVPPVCRGQPHATRRGRRPGFTGTYIALHQTHHRHIQRHSRSISATTRACAPVGLNGKARGVYFSARHWCSAAEHENVGTGT